MESAVYNQVLFNTGYYCLYFMSCLTCHCAFAYSIWDIFLVASINGIFELYSENWSLIIMIIIILFQDWSPVLSFLEKAIRHFWQESAPPFYKGSIFRVSLT